jgi:hypothetical protein
MVENKANSELRQQNTLLAQKCSQNIRANEDLKRQISQLNQAIADMER